MLLLAAGDIAARAREPVRVAVVGRLSADGRAGSLARAVAAHLCHFERVHVANQAVAERLVPTGADVPAEKVADAGKLLRSQFVVIVHIQADGNAAAELVDVASPSRRRLQVQAPQHRFPGELALGLADVMGLDASTPELERVEKSKVANEAAIEAMWRGDGAKEPKEQVRFYRTALRHDPGSALLHNRLGAALARAGQRTQALGEFDQAVTLRPDYAAAHTNRGLVLKREKRWKEAEHAFRRAIELGAKSATPHIGLARLLDRVGATMAAAEQLEKAVELDPSHVAALMSLADYHFESHNLRFARRAVDRVLELEPDNVEALNLLGLLLLVPDDYEKAEEAFRKALATKPEAPDTLANLGLALYGQEKTREATATVERAIALDRTCANAHFYLGRIHMEEKRYQEAVDAFQRAAELKPDWIAARTSLASARHALARQGSGCGCLGGSARSGGLASACAGALLPAAFLLAPHAVRLARRRRRQKS